MGSISEKVRVRQKEEVEAAVKAREESLTERGVTGKALEKDPKYRELKAELRKAVNRIVAIGKRDDEVKAAKDKKEAAKQKKEAAKKKAAAKAKGKGGGKGGGKGKDGGGKKAKKAKKAKE